MNRSNKKPDDIKYNINYLDMLKCFSNALDLLNPSLKNHHKNTAYIAQKIAIEMDLSRQEIIDITIAAAVHDIGACALDDRTLSSDTNSNSMNHHSLAGFLFLNEMDVLKNIATLVRFHHCKWTNGEGRKNRNIDVPIGSHIIHLADRVDTLIAKDSFILHQINDILFVINENSGKMFNHEAVDAFKKIALKKSFWMDLQSESIWDIISKDISLTTNTELSFESDEMIHYVKLLVKLIDFKSNFTATHSTGVAVVAEMISKLSGFSTLRQREILVAGYLHDLGKLSIPNEILEKPDKLTTQEFELMLSHPYHTFEILKNIKNFSNINLWASQHHEKIKGMGYPFNSSGDEIPTESRIIAVADIFTALSEGRPYRTGMGIDSSLKIISDLADTNTLDKDIFGILSDNIKIINEVRINKQSEAAGEYLYWKKSLNYLIEFNS